MHHFCYGFCGKHEVFPFIQNLVRDFAVPLGLSAALLHELVHAASGISQVRGEAPRLQLRLSRSDRRSDMARLNTDAGGGQDCHILYDKFAHPLIFIRGVGFVILDNPQNIRDYLCLAWMSLG